MEKNEISSGRKYAWIAALYFAQGFPAGIINKTMPIVFSAQGVDLAKIGLLSLVGLPWTFKFLWAPIVDRVGERRHWITAGMLGIAACLAAFSFHFHGVVDPGVWLLLTAIAFFSATQDIAIDAGTIEMCRDRELGTANGIRVTAYRVALIVAGGLLVMMAAGASTTIGGMERTFSTGIGWPSTWMILAAAFAAGGVIFLLGVPASTSHPKYHRYTLSETVIDAAKSMLLPAAVAAAAWWAAPHIGVVEKYRPAVTVLFGILACLAATTIAIGKQEGGQEPLQKLLRRPASWAIVLFILTFKIGDAAMAPMTVPFLNRGAHLGESEIGFLQNTLGVGGTIVGAMLGGYLTSRMGIFRSLWVLGLLQAVSNLGYVLAAKHTLGTVVYGAALTEAFCGGLGTAPFLAYLMRLCDKEHAAQQYALLSAVYILSNALAGGVSGYLAEPLGFAKYFLLTFFLAMPAFGLLPFVSRQLEDRPTESC